MFDHSPGRAEAVARLVRLFNERKGAFKAIHVTEGDLGEVIEILDETERKAFGQAKFSIKLENGHVFTFQGTPRTDPHLFDYYFDIVFQMPCTESIRPSGNHEGCYDSYPVSEGTAPLSIDILDGGYESLHGEMAVGSPTRPKLVLRLVHLGAEEFNRPVLEEAVRQERERLKDFEREEQDDLNAFQAVIDNMDEEF